MTDIEIARNTKLNNITEIAKNIGIEEKDLEQYGKYKAKISKTVEDLKNTPKGKLILVTAMTPTPLGEGKTTISIAIADGLKKAGKKVVLALREPSLGPVFGIKGGATGGGNAQVAPMEEINLHFTGDIHAITAANNLLSALIDNHIFNGNSLGFEKVTWKRCLDLNDRQLRKVETGLSGEKGMTPREDGFDITVASEIMAILCLAENIEDLKQRLSNIIVGFNKSGKPIYARDLKAEGSMTVLLKDAIKPNLVQTLEHTPCIIHGGPFANIAHGCNSVIATKMAMSLGDYAVTEAGFGADLGAEKFLNIKCRKANFRPDAVVVVATVKAIKYHGIANLYTHIDNLQNKFGLNVIVALNKYNTDTPEEIEEVLNELKSNNIEASLVEGWAKGGAGAEDIAQKIVNMCSKPHSFKFVYELEDSICTKIEKVAKNIYSADKVNYTDEAKKSIKQIESLGFSNLPICIAKTQYSLSDDSKKITETDGYDITVRDVILKSGAGFIVVLCGKIMTMPGLPKVPAAESIDIDENGEIVGIF